MSDVLLDATSRRGRRLSHSIFFRECIRRQVELLKGLLDERPREEECDFPFSVLLRALSRSCLNNDETVDDTSLTEKSTKEVARMSEFTLFANCLNY